MEADKITISIGNVSLGPGQPVLIQSMCSVSTMDTDACVEQCIRIFDAGGGLVRLTTRNIKEAGNLKIIRDELISRGYSQPISADVHFNPEIAFEAATIAEKVRINPGNFAKGDMKTPFKEFLDLCKKHNTAIRIGVNHGSLSERILKKYGDTPEGMVISALEYLRVCESENFKNVVVSLKSSNTRIMIYSNRLMIRKMKEEGMEYPLHLGVTEAGSGEDGRVRSAVGIGSLLLEGLGDTIRVSLTEEPELEIPVAEKLLEATGRNKGSATRSAAGNNETAITEFKRRDSFTNGLIGGGQVPVVIAEIDENGEPDPSSMLGSSDTDCFHVSDFDFVPDHRLLEDLPADRPYIMNYEAWILDHYPLHNFFPLFDLNGFLKREKESGLLNLILIRPDEVTAALEQLNTIDIPLALVFMHDSDSQTRGAFKELADGTYHPIFIQADYNDTDLELFQVKAAAELAWYFIDGHADGIWLDNPFAGRPVPRSTAFKILQACRARMSETEYIACPSCGRTLFNIQKRLEEVRSATSRQIHLKIAVMGCIVNGIGEMADADYGYVGAGKGKVSLYRRKEIVKKNIAEEDAVEELVKLIKKNGDWKN
jgi:(E)-4-hydroxy-3-methylbut-2-enyl-diphosphate synthase